MTAGEVHRQTIRDAVAAVLEDQRLLTHARRTRIGELDRSIAMLAATRAVEAVIEEIFDA